LAVRHSFAKIHLSLFPLLEKTKFFSISIIRNPVMLHVGDKLESMKERFKERKKQTKKENFELFYCFN